MHLTQSLGTLEPEDNRGQVNYALSFYELSAFSECGLTRKDVGDMMKEKKRLYAVGKLNNIDN